MEQYQSNPRVPNLNKLFNTANELYNKRFSDEAMEEPQEFGPVHTTSMKEFSSDNCTDVIHVLAKLQAGRLVIGKVAESFPKPFVSCN